LVAKVGMGEAEGGQRLGSSHLLVTGHLGQPREVVIVAVGVDGVTDAHPLGSGRLEVGAHIPLRIKDEGLAGLLGADHVRGVAKPLEMELLEEHGQSSGQARNWWVIRLGTQRTTRLVPADSGTPVPRNTGQAGVNSAAPALWLATTRWEGGLCQASAGRWPTQNSLPSGSAITVQTAPHSS